MATHKLACFIFLTAATTTSSAMQDYLTPASPPLSTYPPPPAAAPSPARAGVKAGYWPSWAQPDFDVSEIATSYFTHVYYAFLLLDPSTYTITITPTDKQLLPRFAATLHAADPPAKALISIGGGGSDPDTFSAMVNSSAARSAFIQSAVDAVRTYNLDGADLDWEYPRTQADMDNLALLFQEWRAAAGGEMLLTAAVYYAANLAPLGYDVSYPGGAIGEYLSWANPMCFDYHGSWDVSHTGAPAALFDASLVVSTSYGIQSWLKIGVPSEKLVMGLPLYGRTWELENPAVHGIGASAVATGPGGGEMTFKRVVEFNEENNATVVYDEGTVSTYSYVGTSWIGYDDERSIRKKVRYAKQYELAGYFFWALGQDKDWIISKQASTAWGSRKSSLALISHRAMI